MTRQNNLKVIAFLGNNSEQIVEYLSEQHYPKVSLNNMTSQIEHLSMAGQHRVITNEIKSLKSYEALRHEFPSEVYLISVGPEVPQELEARVDYSIQYNPDQIDELLEKLDFKL